MEKSFTLIDVLVFLLSLLAFFCAYGISSNSFLNQYFKRRNRWLITDAYLSVRYITFNLTLLFYLCTIVSLSMYQSYSFGKLLLVFCSLPAYLGPAIDSLIIIRKTFINTKVGFVSGVKEEFIS